MFGDAIRQRLIVTANRVAIDRSWTAHEVSVHVTAGRQRGQFDAVNFANRLTQVVLQDTVKLKALPSGDSQRAVAEAVAQIKF